MSKMHSINILDYALRSSQGDAEQTREAIRSGNVYICKKDVATLESRIEIPYFLFKNEIKEDMGAIKQAIKDVVRSISDKLSPEQRADTALIIGTALVDKNIVNAVTDTVYDYKRKPYSSSKKSIDSFAQEISQELNLNPFTATVSTACTSSVNAVLEARNLINSDVFRYAIVVGVEAHSKMMSDGFSSMGLLSSDFQKPFDVNRNGLVLGEAIAAVLVGKESSPWSLRGGYSNCNSLNITSVSPSGDEYAEVMNQAIEYAQIKPEDICAVKAHATSTPTNDLSEINAIKKVFLPGVTFTAMKPYVGHTLGACGVLELAMFMSCIDEGFIPKTLNHSESILSEYVPLLEEKECRSGVFMLNYFGFGGNNTSIIIEKELQ